MNFKNVVASLNLVVMALFFTLEIQTLENSPNSERELWTTAFKKVAPKKYITIITVNIKGQTKCSG